MYMDKDFNLDDILNSNTIVKRVEYDPSEVEEACTAWMGCYLANLNPELTVLEDDGTIVLTLTIKE